MTKFRLKIYCQDSSSCLGQDPNLRDSRIISSFLLMLWFSYGCVIVVDQICWFSYMCFMYLPITEAKSPKMLIFHTVFDHCFQKSMKFLWFSWVLRHKVVKNLVFLNMRPTTCTTVQGKMRVEITKYRFFNRKCSKTYFNWSDSIKTWKLIRKYQKDCRVEVTEIFEKCEIFKI